MQMTYALFLASLALCGVACQATVGTGDPSSVDASVDPPDDDPANTPDASGFDEVKVTVEPSTAELAIGESINATATVVVGDETVESPALAWDTSDAQLATVDDDGLIKALAAGSVDIKVFTKGGNSTLSLTISESAECVSGEGDNNDSCADIYQGADIWRCTVSPAQDGATVSQVCRDSKWITFHVDPIDCCACKGAFDAKCCTEGSDSNGC